MKKHAKNNDSENQTQDSEPTQSSQPKAHSDLTKEEELQVQIDELKGQKLSLMADFENYKKRVEAERATFGAMANMSLIQDLLEVSDDISLALNDENVDILRAKEILNIAKDKLIGAAGKSGIAKVEINVGDDFDKEIMEAITVIPDEKNKNKVIAVVSSAYKYSGSDKVLKHAKVIVGR